MKFPYINKMFFI